jgi:hypothetical protein
MSDSTDPAAPTPPSDPARGAAVTVAVTLVLLAALVWALRPPRVELKPAPLEPEPAGCRKVAREFVPSNVTQIPDPSLDGLPPAQRLRALYRMNMEPCRCGCNASIAECRVHHPDCDVSRRLAAQIIAEVQAETAKKK